MTFNQLPALLFPMLGRDLNRLPRVRSFEKNSGQLFFRPLLLILSKQFPDIFARCTIAAGNYLVLDVVLKRLRKRDVE